MTQARIDLNADLGEETGDDEALLDVVSSANVATGAHAGGGDVLMDVTRAAVTRGVAVGAHPSYRDRVGFGRTSLLDGMRADARARAEFVADLREQITLVALAAERAGGSLAHLKPHGSLYNEAVADALAAEIVLDGLERARFGFAVAVMTQPGGELARMAAARGHHVISEGFVDRAYDSTGRLLPRSVGGAVHSDLDTMVGQALALAGERVPSDGGAAMRPPVDSLCVHGDTPGAVVAARTVRQALETAGWRIASPWAR